MYTKTIFAVIAFLLCYFFCVAQQEDTVTCYELRIYKCFPGRVPALEKRFREHTIFLFEKHGIKNIGYWLPANKEPNTLYYIIAYPNRGTRDSIWNAFALSSEWTEVKRKSEEDGKIVDKVISVFMTASAVSPPVAALDNGIPHVFELRKYQCGPELFPLLVHSFDAGGRAVLEKHNIQTIAIWNIADTVSNLKGLMCLFAYKKETSVIKNAWESVKKDARWSKLAMENNGNVVGPHVVLLYPTGFSKMK